MSTLYARGLAAIVVVAAAAACAGGPSSEGDVAALCTVVEDLRAVNDAVVRGEMPVSDAQQRLEEVSQHLIDSAPADVRDDIAAAITGDTTNAADRAVTYIQHECGIDLR